jgi:RNA polymerase sigma-70 factor (sigma-E family)
VKPDQEAQYVEYVRSSLPWLRRVAYLLTQDWHGADDLVQTAFTQLYVHWGRASASTNLDAYARTVVMRAFLGERRSGWARRVVLWSAPPESAAPGGDPAGALDVRRALARVPPRQRATLVLRYYCDLTVEQTADALRCSSGTVKSQTARGLESLRRALVGTLR